MDVIVQEGVRIVFTSAGNPAVWTEYLKKNNVTLVHVIAFKNGILNAMEGDTKLRMKKLEPVRLLKNDFSDAVA